MTCWLSRYFLYIIDTKAEHEKCTVFPMSSFRVPIFPFPLFLLFVILEIRSINVLVRFFFLYYTAKINGYWAERCSKDTE